MPPKARSYNSGMRTVVPCLFLATTLAAQDPGRGVNFYSIEKEKALGEHLAREYRRGADAIDNPELAARIDAIGRALVPQQSRFSYTFTAVEERGLLLNEPPAFPGGYVFVPSGLILAAESTGEVAAMMAHAIAHVEARHGTKQATKAELVSRTTVPLIFMGGWTGFAVRQNAASAIPLGMMKTRREWELQADLYGARLMAAAGIDPAFLARYLERLQQPDTDPADPRSLLPPLAARLEVLRAQPLSAVAARPLPDIRELRTLLAR